MPWWITSENVEQSHSFNIALWKSLDTPKKTELLIKCMILFPEALNPKRSMTKYNNTTLWLCSYCQVLNPNVRDLYSAGGKITHVNGEKLKKTIPQVFNIIVKHANEIKKILDNPPADMLALIEEFNPTIIGNDMYAKWINECNKFASEKNVPLLEWIDNKPTFSFSK